MLDSIINVYIVETKNMGKGVFASKDFDIGDLVLEFSGEQVLPTPGVHTLQIGLDKHLLVDEPYRYVNHSCNPNCGIKDETKLVAMKHVKKGEEITFDYAMTEKHMSAMTCLCNTAKCRKSITGFDGLSEEDKHRYKGFISEYLQNGEPAA